MREFYYKLREFKWHVREAIRAGANRMKHPMTRARSYSWGEEDHTHICLAARLLESADFEAVCPHHGKVEEICWCDDCDYCKYQAIIDFNTANDGSKNITLYIDDKVKTESQ